MGIAGIAVIPTVSRDQGLRIEDLAPATRRLHRDLAKLLAAAEVVHAQHIVIVNAADLFAVRGNPHHGQRLAFTGNDLHELSVRAAPSVDAIITTRRDQIARW